MITVRQIAAELRKYDLALDCPADRQLLNTPIDRLSYNSQEIAENTLFFCKGLNFKAEYLEQAVQNGAVAYIAENKYEQIGDQIAFIQVRDVRRAMSVAAMAFYGHPHRELNLIGITGTKGKTTTAYFIKNILDEYLKSPSAILSSIEIFTGGPSRPSHLTTPESLDLHRYFYEARQNGIQYLTMEVSSQAYKMARVYGLKFSLGLFLNIDADHISPNEHADFEDYLSCKLELIKNCETAVISRQTREYDRVLKTAQDHCQKVITYGVEDGQDCCAENIRKKGNGFTFDMVAEGRRTRCTINMLGRFNVENALAAAVAARNWGIDDASIRAGLAKTAVKGRMNVFEKNGVMVIVDYAHNFLSFSRLYQSIKTDFADRRIVVLFGCPGGKAYARRKDLGILAGQNAQHVYITADDAQYEDVTEISKEIASYIKPFGVSYEIIPDRKTAVETAIKNAKAGDVVILAAKGEELYQKVRGEYVPFESDLVLAQRYLGLL